MWCFTVLRSSFGKLGRRIESQSTIGRVATLVGAVVLFVIAQQIAGISNAAENGSAAVEAFAGLVALVLVIVAVYAVYATIRAFVRGARGSVSSAD